MSSADERRKSGPILVEYTRILHQYTPDSQQARDFKELHADDEKFQKRAKTLDRLWMILKT